MALNKVIMVGRLSSDPELKQTPTGVSVARFGIAINRGKGEADFFDIVAWRQTAEFVCRYFEKGDGICIDGHLTRGSYEKNGQTIPTYTITADNVGFAEGRKNSGAVQESGGPKSASQQASDLHYSTQDTTFEEVSDDNLPF